MKQVLVQKQLDYMDIVQKEIDVMEVLIILKEVE